MGVSYGIALCVAYLFGLVLSPLAISWGGGNLLIPWACVGGAFGVWLWGTIAPPHLRLGWRRGQWLFLGGVVLLAGIYISLRSPHPGPYDISRYVDRMRAISPIQVVTGQVIDEPRLNRDLKGRFRIAARQVGILDADGNMTFAIAVRGNLYITAPLLQTTGLHRGEWIKATGRSYLPDGAKNPNGFDFQAYLEQRNTFAGFVADELRFPEGAAWGLWQVRRRIVKAQLRALGSPLGQVVSAMALGRNAVDLPLDIQDLFSRVGLAHTIAASGFHVSLLLGTVLALLRSRPDKIKAFAGMGILLGYILLTGIQASVIRAALMGSATLAGLITNRKVMPSGALLLAATLMLLVNPCWIWDIGFQLSVVATLGLIVLVPPLTRWLDWLPVTLASLVAVPIAATLWTLPLTLYHFNVFAGLSVLLNAIATPIVTIISLGGMFSSLIALGMPPLGTTIAQFLEYPTQMLLWLAQTASQIPGSSIAVGQIALWQVILLLGTLMAASSKHPFRKRLNNVVLAGIFMATIAGPMGWRLLTQDQVTLLSAGDEMVWVQQKQGRTTLFNSGGEKTAFYTVAPYLKQAGVNRIDNAIALPLGV